VNGIELEQVDGVPVARAVGDIDAANATRVRDELADALARHGTDQIVLDLSGTRYVDSAGIDMLFRLAERLRQRRAALLLVIPPDSQLARLAAIVSLPSAVAIHDSVDQALGIGAQGSTA
jgi:anti-sigma B factor antagonist